MAAVIAAILATLAAGGVALARERRNELRDYLVACRVLLSLFVYAAAGLATMHDSTRATSWSMLDATPGRDAFSATWEEHRNVIAAHVTYREWRLISQAVTSYLTATYLDRDDPPEASKDSLLRAADDLMIGVGALAPYLERARWFHKPGGKDAEDLSVRTATEAISALREPHDRTSAIKAD